MDWNVVRNVLGNDSLRQKQEQSCLTPLTETHLRTMDGFHQGDVQLHINSN